MYRIALEYFTKISEELTSGNFYLGFIYKHYLYHTRDNITYLNPIARAILGDTNAIESLHLDDNVNLPINIDDHLVEPNPNPSQRTAIEMALTKPISFIQGPPGTGKSRTILNIMSCITNGLGKTVLMVSTNNAAVDVISSKILGYEGSDNLNRQNLFNTYAKLGNKRNLEEFSGSHEDFRFNMQYPEITEYEVTSKVKLETTITYDEFTSTYKAITSTIHSMKKFFKDGLNAQFDYVIMDEASQINTMLGIIAASCAKHLIIVGDKEQLAPIVSEKKIRDVNSEYHQILNANNLDCYIQNDLYGCPPSIIDLCLKKFKGHNNEVMLIDHYRCHPGIIEFSNRNIYHDLECRSSDDDIHSKAYEYAVPIRIKWFNGSYCEKTRVFQNDTEEGSYHVSKCNRKQITIFINEELDSLLEKMRNLEDGLERFCILSPYRGQLYELQKALKAEFERRQDEDDDPLYEQLTIELTNSGAGEDADLFEMLSVHRSQGREYDVVYFFPVEDGNWERPWAQSKSLINVATSRAKKELHIIASTTMMSKNMQLALTGKYCPPRRQEIDERPQTENLRYVQMLIDYTKIANDTPDEYNANKKVWDKEGIYEGLDLPGKRFEFPISNDEYGFHETDIKSVFDAIPITRSQERALCEEKRTPFYLLEQLVKTLICTVPQYKKYRLYSDVQLRDLVDKDGNPILTQAQVEDKTNARRIEEGITPVNYWGDTEDEKRPVLHIDSVVCDENNRCILFIEVDGEYHRFFPVEAAITNTDPITNSADTTDLPVTNITVENMDSVSIDVEERYEKAISKEEDLKLRDKLKVELSNDIYKVPMLRLPTDGTCYNEKQMIIDSIRESLNTYERIPYVKKKTYKNKAK